MRAATLTDVGRPLVVEEVADPSPGSDELVLRVLGCGICGSDLHISEAFVPAGRVLGHEFAGEIVARGADAAPEWREGQLVAGFPVFGCGACLACRNGAPSKCAATELVGIERPGAFAEYVAITTRQAVALPEGTPPAVGALVEPLAVALHALDCTPITPGATVLVLGGGPVGATVALWAPLLGAGQVVVSEPAADRRRLAERLGAATVDPAAGDVRTAVTELTGAAPSVVVECVGVPGLIQHTADIADPDGWITVVGVCMQPDQLLPVVPMLKELTMRFVTYYRMRDFHTTIAMLSSGRLDPGPMLSAEIGLDDLPARFEALKRPGADCKVTVTP